MPYDPLAALRTLQRYGVQFVVIGRVAGRLWGSPTTTDGTEVCYSLDSDNRERLVAALRELLDAATLSTSSNLTFMTRNGPLGVLGAPPGTAGFADLAVNAVELDVGNDLVMPVCDLDDLIRMDRATGRAPEEVDVLLALREELDASH